MNNELRVRSFVAYKNDALDGNKWPVGGPRVRRLAPDGSYVYENVPTAPSVRAVHPAGHIVSLVMHAGSGRPNSEEPCFHQIWRRKAKLGFLPYGTCPKFFGLHDHLDPSVRAGAPCEVAADGSQIDDDHPCACVVATRDARVKDNELAMARVAARYQTQYEEEKMARDAERENIRKIAEATTRDRVKK